ncbi:MAG: acetylglucosaminyldiphosphoundecaprenol acetyl-beta-D-mannosaminyltransferase [Patescibacteria group bacterium]|nr:MAG: acetylglucosaminyldiphosphoundecaprenol acetyl-beta-D-mannosaminyltransferase [Patescibacteria group bacterium]
MKNYIFGIGVSNITEENALELVLKRVKNGKKKCMIVTPNPEIVMYALSHPIYKRIINEADLALCDGIGLFLAGSILGKPFRERITGVDFMDKLCAKASENAVTVGFLGGRHGVAEKTAECLRKKYPGLIIKFSGEEWDVKTFPKEGVDILFVAFGFPKQEEWIAKYLPMLPIKVAMGVGGAFDYLSGRVKRAPFFIRSLGLEWLYRLIHQPWRIKRQVVLPQFLYLVLKQKMRIVKIN